MDQYIGKLLDNRYEILEVVGTGGMARVYKARCHRLNRLVAIKILREDLSQDAEFRRRFHDESQAVAMLSHPNIVAVYDVSRSSELEYIVMELIDGITLKQYMQKKGNKLNWREALHFITQIAKALGHAHSRGIIHRDIKPHNVMVLRDGSVKVADFGIARLASGGHSTLTQEALGSVHYISPEQARGSHIDARSDLYSAGVVLYEMITGRLPFEGDTPVSVAIQHINSIPLSPRELDPSIPEALETITMKAMAPSPDSRYLSADEMLSDLEEFRKNPSINFNYSVAEFAPEKEPDSDRTQVRAPSYASYNKESRERSRSGGRSQAERPMRQYDEEDRRGGFPWGILLSVTAILIFLGGVFYFLYSTFFSGLFSPPQTYTVPNLVGENYEKVLQDQELLGRFTLAAGDPVTDDAPAGTILEQSPAADSQVGAAVTEIKVTVSGGPEVVYMIDLFNMEYRQAYIALDAIGLTHDTKYAHHEEIEMYHVISFTPLPDAPLAPGAEVQMVVSLGPSAKDVTLPSFVELTQEKAESDIRTMKLEVGAVEPVFHDTIEEGRVVSQYPLAATEVPEGTVINLQVSKGPDPSTVTPDDITKTVDIPLPPSGMIVNLVVMVDGAVVMDANLDTAFENSTPITITAPAGSQKTITYFIDGVRTGGFTLDFTP